MRKTSKPLIGGLLAIMSGVLGIVGSVSYWIGIGGAGSGFARGDIPPFVPSIIYGLPIPSIIIAFLALLGGIFALQRKKWTWALVAGIAAVLSFILLGIPALALITLSKNEFN
jgi:hypothetical protein